VHPLCSAENQIPDLCSSLSPATKARNRRSTGWNIFFALMGWILDPMLNFNMFGVVFQIVNFGRLCGNITAACRRVKFANARHYDGRQAKTDPAGRDEWSNSNWRMEFTALTLREREAKERAVECRKQGINTANAECSSTVTSLIFKCWGTEACCRAKM
jgi:hypothetical protein